jgi:CO/xanthine dehydrogenase Mo-binding subunit
LVRLNRQGYATLFTGSCDIGQGSDTVMTALVAETLGLKMEDVKIVTSDTTLAGFDTGTFGSKVTYLSGNATYRAAAEARDLVIACVAGRLGVPAETIICKNRRFYVENDPEKGMSYEDAVYAAQEEKGGREVFGIGTYAHEGDERVYIDGKANFAPTYSFSTGAAKVKVDGETGQVELLEFIFAHDCGRPLNIRAVEGQVEGCVHLGLGYTLFEECLLKDGKMLNPSFRDYRFPTALDTPKIKVIICGEPDPGGPYGAKEAGEGGTAPIAPAIVNAVTNATGVYFHSLPLTPENLWKELREKKAEIKG